MLIWFFVIAIVLRLVGRLSCHTLEAVKRERQANIFVFPGVSQGRSEAHMQRQGSQ